jgi:hypothetical protein
VVVFFAAGFMLAFFLPLIPFYRFLFGVLSWFLSVVEAVIAVPLIALAHLTPEGEGFMGDKAKAAYYMVFNIFLKPTLMIFGLVTGYLMFLLLASMMNILYITAVAGAGGISNGHYTLARIAFSIIYVVLLYLGCNKCFQSIDWLPEYCIKWMGAQGMHHANMGDPMEIGGYMGLASGYVEQKIVGGAGQIMSGPAGALALGAMHNNKATSGAISNAIGTMGGQLQQAGANAQQAAGFTNVANKGLGWLGGIEKKVEQGTTSVANAIEEIKGGNIQKVVGTATGSSGTTQLPTPPIPPPKP